MGGNSQWNELCNYQCINIYIKCARDSYLPLTPNDNLSSVPQPGSFQICSIFKPRNCEGHTGHPRSFALVQQNRSLAPVASRDRPFGSMSKAPLGWSFQSGFCHFTLFLFLNVCFKNILLVMLDEGQAIQTQWIIK